MGFYSQAIFPRFCDCLMDKPFWAKYRKEQLASVDGEILEIGVGTGLNLPHYPEHVRRIVTVDPNPGMNKRLQRRIDQSALRHRIGVKLLLVVLDSPQITVVE